MQAQCALNRINDMRKNMFSKILFSLFFLFLHLVGISQGSYKLVEQSAKEKPSWTRSSDPYLFQAIKVPSLDDAKNIVKSDLLTQIASSVASTISADIVVERDEKNTGNTSEFNESIEVVIKTKVAKMPALQGISLTKANIYWERFIDKKTKETYYDYYMLYPFSSLELQELIDTYNAQEKAINDKISGYRDALDNVDDIDLLVEYIDQMKRMKKELVEEKDKCDKLNDIIKVYEKMLKNIYVEVLENSNSNNIGTLVVQLKCDGKVMKTKSLPTTKGICARDFTKKHEGDKIIVSFNTYDCYEQDDNYVELRVSFGKAKLNSKININLK